MKYVPAILFATLLIIIALMLNRGKGQWLIAGFNTMPPEKRKEYDMTAVNKFVSRILMIMALCLLAFDYGWYKESIPLIVLAWVVFVFVTVFALMYARGNRFKKNR